MARPEELRPLPYFGARMWRGRNGRSHSCLRTLSIFISGGSFWFAMVWTVQNVQEFKPKDLCSKILEVGWYNMMQLTKASNLRCCGISVTGFPQPLGCCCALSLPSLRYRASEGRFAADFSGLVASNRGFWTHGWATIGRFAWVLNSSNLAWWCSFLLNLTISVAWNQGKDFNCSLSWWCGQLNCRSLSEVPRFWDKWKYLSAVDDVKMDLWLIIWILEVWRRKSSRIFSSVLTMSRHMSRHNSRSLSLGSLLLTVKFFYYFPGILQPWIRPVREYQGVYWIASVTTRQRSCIANTSSDGGLVLRRRCDANCCCSTVVLPDHI